MVANVRRTCFRTVPVVSGALLTLALAMVANRARAGEIVPSIGISRSVHQSSDTKPFGSLAIRGKLLPFLKSEVGLAYRSETRNGGDLEVKMWPLTASVWAAPTPNLYLGGGVGWYQTSLEYAPSTGLANETRQEFGVHLGGGFTIPLAPIASIDLQSRAVFMERQSSQLPPNEFDPDFWTTTAGLAIRF